MSPFRVAVETGQSQMALGRRRSEPACAAKAITTASSTLIDRKRDLKPVPKAAPREVLGLSDSKGLVVSIADQRSLAWSTAEHLRNAGAELAIETLQREAE